MNAQTTQCDHRTLEALLADQLTDAEHAAAEQHLESCESCRSALLEMAGDAGWWQQAGDFLKPMPEDVAMEAAGTDSPSSSHIWSTDELGPVEFALDFLEASDNPAMIGRLGEYEILELIGRGGMGVVLKGYQRELNRYVAIKVMAPHYASSAAARKRFAREAQAAAAVVHPHVVSIHSVNANAKLPYLAMPFVDCQSLQMRIDQNGPMELKDVLRIGKQTAEGLAAAHAQGLVHRDVKPANILLEDGVGRVQLTDFGLARAVDDATMTRSGVIAGTPQYMSPEQASGSAIDRRADLFSLGSVLYTMCAGHSPFRAETTMGVLRRICEDTPRPLCDVNADMPPWLGRLVSRLHAKNPSDRFSSADEVAELLEQCLAHVQQPSVVALPEVLQEPAEPTATNTWHYGRLGLVGVALPALVGVVLMVQPPKESGDGKNEVVPTSKQESTAEVADSPSANATTHSASSPVTTRLGSASTVWDDGVASQIQQMQRQADSLQEDVKRLSSSNSERGSPTEASPISK